MAEDPATVLEADEQLAQRLSNEEYSLVDRMQDNLTEFRSKRIWLSMPDQAAVDRFRM